MIKQRKKVRIPKVLSEKDIEKLISIPSVKSKTGIRNKAVIGTLAYAGLRVGELINLRVKDIDFKEGWLHIKRGKTGDRDIPISPTLEPYLMAWNNIKPKHSRYFFSTHKGKRIFSAYIRTMIKRYAVKSGLGNWIHPHTLRHSFATSMLARNDINIDNLKNLLGHSHLSSTEVYLHTLPKDLHKKIRGKKDIEEKQQDLNNLYQQFLTTQKDLANQVKEIINKALKE